MIASKYVLVSVSVSCFLSPMPQPKLRQMARSCDPSMPQDISCIFIAYRLFLQAPIQERRRTVLHDLPLHSFLLPLPNALSFNAPRLLAIRKNLYLPPTRLEPRSSPLWVQRSNRSAVLPSHFRSFWKLAWNFPWTCQFSREFPSPVNPGCNPLVYI